jgi:hypothetical protein
MILCWENDLSANMAEELESEGVKYSPCLKSSNTD